MKIAIMQPYFMPYLGYMRLFAESDLFVLYDCVQFPRRGWVHRNRVMRDGQLRWVTLPLHHQPVATPIQQLRFRDDALQWYAQLRRQLPAAQTAMQRALLQQCLPQGSVVDYLERQLVWLREQFGLRTPVLRSSSLQLPDHWRGEQRILGLCQELGATEYVNASGGVGLYQAERFAEAGVGLEFLPPFEGRYESLLGRLWHEPLPWLRRELFVSGSRGEMAA